MPRTLFSRENFYPIVESIQKSTSYNLKNLAEQSIFEHLVTDLKIPMILFILRLNDFKQLSQDPVMMKYLEFLYGNYTGNGKKLSALFSLAERTVFSWNGKFEKDQICLNDNLKKYWVLENCPLKITGILKSRKDQPEKINRFIPSITLKQSKPKTAEKNEIDVDYSLFDLMHRIDSGNRPTLDEQTRYVDFYRFVQNVISSGDRKEELLFKDKGNDQPDKTYYFKKSDYIFEFGE